MLFLVLQVLASEAWGGSIEVDIQGITGDPLKNVEIALRAPAGLVTEDGTVKREWLDYFVQQIPARVRAALEPFGYYNAHTVATETSEGSSYRIRVDISPGQPITVGIVNVRIEGPGATEGRLSDLARNFPLNKGDILRQDIYEEAKGRLHTSALELGYLGAYYSEHSIRISLAGEEAEIRLILQTGDLYRFGAVHFSGAPSYPSVFLHRFLTFRTGDVYSGKKIGETQLNLRNADRFSDVFVEAHKADSGDLAVPVTVRLKEAPTKRIKSGVGYTTDIGPRLSFQYKDVNVLNRGYELNSELNISERLQAFASNFIIPDYKDIKGFTSFNLKFQREDVQTYTTRLASLELDRTWSFEMGRLGSIYATAMRENSVAGDNSTNTFSIYPGVRVSARRYDDLKRPTRGYYCQADLRGTHRVLGSDTVFAQAIIEGNFLVPLPGQFSLFARARMAGTAQNDSTESLPIPFRFFAGGDRSVRGYSYQSLGPKDSSGNVVGGKNLLVASLQIERAIGRNFGVLAFYDTGNAFNSFTQMDLAQGAGLGFRYYTPIGPIELCVARQIGTSDPGYRLHFSIGFSL